MSNTPNSNATTIELPTFNGPLDLLLHLIERNELDVTGVSLSKVAEQYLQRVRELKTTTVRIDNLMEFIVIGAQLVLIKSRALLPQNPVTVEGEEEEDPAEALARRLREYKQFKEVTATFKWREKQKLRTYLRVAQTPYKKVKGTVDMTGITIDSLQRAMLDAFERAEALADSVDVAKKPKVTIEGQISRVRQSIRAHGRFQFR
ncbi:MAG: ScpA family protein [Chloroflexota bacterium]